jgi:ribosomal protein S21
MRHSVNVSVELRPGEPTEKLIRRFFKKCKKSEIIREHLEKVSHARTRTQKKRDKIQKNKHLRKIEASRLARKMK